MASRLGIDRLLVTDLAGDLVYCAGLWRPTVVVGQDLLVRLRPAALEAVRATGRPTPAAVIPSGRFWPTLPRARRG
jgi:hypothetical protein